MVYYTPKTEYGKRWLRKLEKWGHVQQVGNGSNNNNPIDALVRAFTSLLERAVAFGLRITVRGLCVLIQELKKLIEQMMKK